MSNFLRSTLNFFTNRYFIVISILAIAMALYVFANCCGLGLTYDSRDYLYAAKTFGENFELYNAKGSLYVERSPLFPVFLSFLGQNRLWISLYLNGVFLFLSLWLLYRIASKLFRHTQFLYLFLLSQSFGLAHLLAHSFLWSEPLFLLLLVLCLTYFYKYLKEDSLKYLACMIVLSFLFALQRNTGIFFIVAIGLCIFIFSSKKVFLRHSLFYIVLSSSGWVLWTLRSISLKGSGFHPATEVLFQNISTNLYHYSNVASAWLLPLSLPYALRVVFLLLLLTCLMYSFLQKPRSKNRLQMIFLQALMLIATMYSLALCSLENVGYHESERYFSIIYPMFFLVIFTFLEMFCSSIKYKNIKIYFILILALWLTYPAWRSLKNTQLWHGNRCYNTEILKKNPTSNHIINKNRVYSRAVAYYLTIFDCSRLASSQEALSQ